MATKPRKEKAPVTGLTIAQHVRGGRGMWAGSAAMEKTEMYLLDESDKKISRYDIISSYTLNKIFDEIITNCADHQEECKDYSSLKERVTLIDVNINPSTGEVSVFNNGAGIDIHISLAQDNRILFGIHMMFGIPLSGTNFGDITDGGERTGGGQNGLGAKLTAILSTRFNVETVDQVKNLYYYQEFNNGTNDISIPIIIDLNTKCRPKEVIDNILRRSNKKLPKYMLDNIDNIVLPEYKYYHYSEVPERKIKQGTTIIYEPDFAWFIEMDKKSNTTSSRNKSKKTIIYQGYTKEQYIQSMTEVARFRAATISAYTETTVRFNKVDMHISFNSFCNMICEYDYYITTINDWKVCIAITTSPKRDISIVNGVFASTGTHLDYLKNKLSELFKEKVIKEVYQKNKSDTANYRSTVVTNNIQIIMQGIIPNVAFDAQNKDKVVNNSSIYEDYNYSSEDLNQIWIFVRNVIHEKFISNQLSTSKRIKGIRELITDIDKFTDATNCRSETEWQHCGLALAEGDSAKGALEESLVHTPELSPKFNPDYVGIYTTGGVLMNALKQSVEIKYKGLMRRLPSKRFFENIRFTNFTRILNLDYDKTYAKDEEFKTLRYGYVFAIMDQDLDGFNICGLLLTFFLTYFPALVKRGYVRKINTPIMRLYPKKAYRYNYTENGVTKPRLYIKSFYSNEQYDEWMKSVGGTNYVDKYYGDIKYYKGLGSHSEDRGGEVSQMFRSVFDKTTTFLLDTYAETSMHIYYGKETSLRKDVLRTLDPDITEQIIAKLDGNGTTKRLKDEASLREKQNQQLSSKPLSKKELLNQSSLDYSDDELNTIDDNNNNNINNTFTNGDSDSDSDSDDSDDSDNSDIDGNILKRINIVSKLSSMKKSLTVLNNNGIPIKLSSTEYFASSTKPFQLDNLKRKLPSDIDGLVESRRKLLFILKKIKEHAEIKVSALAGKLTDIADYAHGEKSAQDMIVGQAQHYPNARNIPLLIPLGNFGARRYGYKNAAQPRYIHVLPNTKIISLMFPDEDDPLLIYDTYDGNRYEPRYYVPIIPYVLCENYHIPGTGWSIHSYARNYKNIFSSISDMIYSSYDNNTNYCTNGDDDTFSSFTSISDVASSGNSNKPLKLNIWKKDFRGNIIHNPEKNKQMFVGKYIYDPDVDPDQIIVTELPPNIYSYRYITGKTYASNTSDDGDKKKTKGKKKYDKDHKEVDKLDKEFTKDESKKESIGIANKKYVMSCRDQTNMDSVKIIIKLAPGSIRDIQEKYGTSLLDPIEDYLELYEYINPNLNFIDENGLVRSYKNYEDIFTNWFKVRKELYIKRTEREIVLVGCEILKLTNMQAFTKNHKNSDHMIDHKMPETMAISILSGLNYKTINTSILSSPGMLTADELRVKLYDRDQGASYDYILDMKYSELLVESFDRRTKKLDKLTERLKVLSDNSLFLGAKIWLNELDQLEKVIKQGLATKWTYGENDGLVHEEEK